MSHGKRIQGAGLSSRMRRIGLTAVLALLVLPLGARAFAQQKSLPIITGTRQSSMDAPEKNSELEHYAHSPTVARIAHSMGMSTASAARLFEDINSGLLILAILWYALRVLPGKFRERKQKLAHDLTEAHRASDEARERLSRIEQKLARLGGEVDELRRHAAEMSQADEARIHAAQEEERQRILRAAEAEIVAAQENAERGLKRFAANLAVDKAAAQVRLSPESDQMLIDSFLQGLAGELSREGKN